MGRAMCMIAALILSDAVTRPPKVKRIMIFAGLLIFLWCPALLAASGILLEHRLLFCAVLLTGFTLKQGVSDLGWAFETSGAYTVVLTGTLIGYFIEKSMRQGFLERQDEAVLRAAAAAADAANNNNNNAAPQDDDNPPRTAEVAQAGLE